ncbi:MAG: efflux RND transporter periplasmic adaptor subunit [Spirochaetales bacterium]|nr:efflux RND transporter periplasmic adaptor subunit [Spirochaetales bacterium]
MKTKQANFNLFKLLPLAAVMFIQTITGSCFPAPPPVEQETVFAVNVIPVAKGEINDYIQVNGDVESLASIDVFANNNGEVISINVGLGQYVSAGQLIAKVDPSRPGQNFLPNPVRAPISGTIIGLPVRVGSTITVQTAIAKISRTSELEIVTNVAERFIADIKVGLDALARFQAFPEQVFKAKIKEVSPVLDPVTRSLQVKLRFTEKAGQVKAGMFAEIKIITKTKKDIVKIPAYCLVRRFEKIFVFVVKDESWVEQREVIPGIEIDNKLEILSGLKPDEIIIAQGQKVLEDQAKVRIIETLPPLSAEDIIQ